jgi:hypothetical protein
MRLDANVFVGSSLMWSAEGNSARNSKNGLMSREL